MASFIAIGPRKEYRPEGVYDVPGSHFMLRGRAVYIQDEGTPQQIGKIASNEEVKSIILSKVQAVANLQMYDFNGALGFKEFEKFYPQIFSHSGALLQSFVTDLPFGEPVKNKDSRRFRAAKKTGDIVVNDYFTGSGRVLSLPRISSEPGWLEERVFFVPWVLDLGGRYDEASWQNPVIIDGKKFVELPIIHCLWLRTTFTQEPARMPYDPKMLVDAILSGLQRHPDVDTPCVANANAGTVDLATSLAEAPETLKSVLEGCIKIFRLYKDAKKGDLRLQNQVKRVAYEWDRDRAILEANKDRAALRRRRNQFLANSKELTTAIANVWLNFRLNIYPTAKDIEKTIDALKFGDHKVDFIRFRETDKFNLKVLDAELQYTYRCFIKRSIDPTSQLDAYFTVNVSRTAWELVPLSFIIDRYMNIGDWITANLSSPNQYRLVEGSTVSWRMNTSGSLDRFNVISVDLYKRLVFSSDSYCPLYFPKDRSRDQILDQLAIAWNLISRKA